MKLLLKFIPILSIVLQFGLQSCNSSSVTDSSDSTVLKTDSLSSDSISDNLVLEESVVQTMNRELIKLNKGEWYMRGEFMNYDKNRGMLIFKQDNGFTREIMSNPWNRMGKMLISNDRFISLTPGKKYEIVYFYQFENPNILTNRASGFYISDIAPFRGYFPDANRYVKDSGETGLSSAKIYGKFLDDLKGGMILVKKTAGSPEFWYSASASGMGNILECEMLTRNVIKTSLSSNAGDVFFCFKDGEWLCTDGEGECRVFRTENLTNKK